MKVVTILYTFLIISGMLFTSQTCFSQRKITTTIISFDFKTKSFNPFSFEDIEEGDYYQLKITNFNSNLYKVSLVAQDTVLETKIEFPTFGSFSVDALTKVFDLSTKTDTDTWVNQMDRKSKPVIVDKEKEKLIKRIQLEIDNLYKINKDIIDIKTHVDILVFKIKKQILASQVEYKEDDIYEKLTAKFNFSDIIDSIEINRSSLSAILKDATEKEKSYLGFIKDYNKYLDEKTGDENIKAENVTVKTGYANVIKVLGVALDSLSAEKSAQLLSGVIYVHNNKDYIYKSLPFRLSGDLGTLELKIEPRDPSKSLLQNYSTTIQFPDLYKKERFFGINTAFYISGLHDESYSVSTSEKIKTTIDSSGAEIPSDTVQNYTVYQNNSGNTEIGMQALVCLGFRIFDSDYSKFMFSFGPAINLNNTVRPRVSVGAGLAFGKRNILTINGGWIGGSVNVKSDAIVIGGAGTETKPDQLTNSKFSSSWFFSLGYFFNP